MLRSYFMKSYIVQKTQSQLDTNPNARPGQMGAE